MPSIAIIGCQWGDEGKAKIVDYLAENADAVVRTSGGNNAGHTVVVAGDRYRFSTVPCGILHKNVLGIIGNGTAINPPELLAELDALKEKGLPVENVRISTHAHLVMPYHIILDGLMDEIKDSEKGDGAAARRGIRPCYMDKYERCGIRVCDLLDPDVFARKVRGNVALKNRMITKVYGGVQTVDAEEIIREFTEYGRRLAPYVTDTGALTADMLDEGSSIIFEGAQATLLDPDYGTYPHVTTSHPTVGGVICGSGIGLNRLDHCIGVMKSYMTRAGRGAFPTELFGPQANALREAGNEYEVSGRYRRIGWFDAVAGRYAVRINGMECIALTKLNTLRNLDEVKICVGYRYKGEELHRFPADGEMLAHCEPVYETMKGWGPIDSCNSYDELPAEARAYVERIEELVQAKVAILELGLGRNKIFSRSSVSNWLQSHRD